MSLIQMHIERIEHHHNSSAMDAPQGAFYVTIDEDPAGRHTLDELKQLHAWLGGFIALYEPKTTADDRNTTENDSNL